MWNWKPAKMVLEALWDRGQLVIAGRRSFQRLYDLTERVIPKHVLEAPTPPEDETLRTFALLAVRARGALTEAAIREHWRLKGGKARLHHHLLALVDEGRLREVHVDDGGAPFYVDAEHELDGDRRAARARLAVRQPRLGPAAPRARLRLPARDRGLQARARARVRLLRAAAPRRRPLRRPRRPEGRPRGGRAARQAVHTGAARAWQSRRQVGTRSPPSRAHDRPGAGRRLREVGRRGGAADRRARAAARRQRDRRARRPSGASASCSSTRSRPSRRRSTSSSGAGSATATTRPSSTACSGRSGSSSSGTRSSSRPRTCRSCKARMRRRDRPLRPPADRVPEGERRVPPLRAARARAARAAALARDRGSQAVRSARRTAGGARARWG